MVWSRLLTLLVSSEKERDLPTNFPQESDPSSTYPQAQPQPHRSGALNIKRGGILLHQTPQ